MDIDKLIEAAKEIDRLAELQEQKTLALQELARDARAGLDRKDVARRRQAIDQGGRAVIDFGTAVAKLRAALRDPGAGKRDTDG